MKIPGWLARNTSGTFTWKTKDQISDGIYHLKATARDGAGSINSLSALYIVDNTPPPAPVLSEVPRVKGDSYLAAGRVNGGL